MASTVAAPLERKLGQISGIDQITSTSSLGTTNIQLTFRSAATSTAPRVTCRPRSTPRSPICRATCRPCLNSASPIPPLPPVFVLALTSKTLTTGAIYDVADTVIAQRISQVPGVGDATVSGADQPAVRVPSIRSRCRMQGSRPTTSGIAIINANPLGPVGIFNGSRQSETLALNKQMRTAEEFRNIIIKSAGGNFVRLADVAEVEDLRNSRSIAWFNKQPAVLIQITKQGDANVIDTVDRVKALIPD